MDVNSSFGREAMSPVSLGSCPCGKQPEARPPSRLQRQHWQHWQRRQRSTECSTECSTRTALHRGERENVARAAGAAAARVAEVETGMPALYLARKSTKRRVG